MLTTVFSFYYSLNIDSNVDFNVFTTVRIVSLIGLCRDVPEIARFICGKECAKSGASPVVPWLHLRRKLTKNVRQTVSKHVIKSLKT